MSARHAWYPSPDQELLLRAALLPGEAAERAWVQWREAHWDEQFDPGSFRLLPLVYRNLATLGSDDAWLGRLKGIYRRAWFLNQSLLHWGAGVVGRLEAAGVPTLLLKGAGLSLAHYRDLGVRPMDDLDVAVPLDRRRAAIDELLAAGLRAESPFTDEQLAYVHAEEFAGPDGRRLDLHWSVLWRPGADDGLWHESVPVELHGTATRTLSPTDHLFHACDHGVYWSPIHPLRWVADVHVILRSGAIDWERLVQRALDREATLSVEQALRYMHERFGADLPDGLLSRLARERVRPLRRVAHRVAGLPPSRTRSVGMVALYLDMYRAGARVAGGRPSTRGFIRHLQRHAGVDGPRQLAARGVRILSRRDARRDANPVMARR
ncbi:MAG: hypothetical protein QOG63_2351 [Thermoleophilaceae bacterium]|jgi:hypothetical protein|nr:hypothetical protein [Thermoleophilaceae bacterium]